VIVMIVMIMSGHWMEFVDGAFVVFWSISC
jgi:hypothetical protein